MRDLIDNSPGLQGVLHACHVFIQVGFIYLAYWLAKRAASAVARKSGVPLTLFVKTRLVAGTFLVVLFVTFGVSRVLGKYGTVVDLVPAGAQKDDQVAFYMTFFGVPALIGLRAGLRSHRDSTSK